MLKYLFAYSLHVSYYEGLMKVSCSPMNIVLEENVKIFYLLVISWSVANEGPVQVSCSPMTTVINKVVPIYLPIISLASTSVKMSMISA